MKVTRRSEKASLRPQNPAMHHNLTQAMINATTLGYEKSVLEVADIKKLAAN
jgi:hypothetical protein